MKKQKSKVKTPTKLQEDRHFSRVADKRLSQKQKRTSHNKAWK